MANDIDNDPGSPQGYEGDDEEEETGDDYEEQSSEQQDSFNEDDLNNNKIVCTNGVQEWSDGSVYKGEFAFDLKLGYGEFAWNNGEVI